MKKLAVPVLILSCFFSSPNFGTLFNTTAAELFSGASHPKGQELKIHAPKAEGAVLTETPKKARLLKRALFVLPSVAPIIFSLFAFFLTLPIFQAAVSRKPFFLYLRSPPRY